MKHTQAVIACSLLGSLWLASCSSSNKNAVPPQAEAGAAGESAGGSGGETPAAVGGEPGEAGAGGQSIAGQGGEGGAAPVCFNDLNELLAGAPGIEPGAGGAGSAVHAKYSCETVKALFSPTYDAANNSIKLDVSLLGPTVSGDYTYFYDTFNGETNETNCADGLIQTVGTQLVLPVEPNAVGKDYRFTALRLQDQCGNDAALSQSENDCVNLRLSQGEGETFFVDCETTECYPTCADFNSDI